MHTNNTALPKVTLQGVTHRNEMRMVIYCKVNLNINKIIKTLPDARWSKSLHGWHVPLTKQSYGALQQALRGKALIYDVALRNYLQHYRKVAAIQPKAIVKPELAKPTAPIKKLPVATVKAASKISNENLVELAKYIQHLQLHAYSKSTIKTYRVEFMQLLKRIGNIPVRSLTTNHIKRYMQIVLEHDEVSEHTAHSRLNALKYYFEQVLKQDKFFYEIPRPKKPLQLPNVMGQNDISKLFTVLNNVKHKAILFTAYSAGLRVSEVVQLKIADIDSDRMVIKVVDAKGKKDRYVGLSQVVLEVLRNYLKLCKPRPKVYLFEGDIPGTPYASRSAQKVFQRAKQEAGIQKQLSFHSLRHSYATHLLEKGIDIRFIKDMLGHFSIKTTERYTHVSKVKAVSIVSPLDDLFNQGYIGIRDIAVEKEVQEPAKLGSGRSKK
jgi:site-specific recombinase XerD